MVDWRVAKSLNVLFTQINDLAPGRSRVSDGSIGDAAHATRTSDHNPWITDPPGPNVVSARDFTHDPDRGADMGDIFEALRLSRDRRIKYGIFNWRIFTYYPAHGYPAWTWRPYSGPNGHKTHGHLSVRSEKHLYDNADPWPIQGDDMVDRKTSVGPNPKLAGDFDQMLEAKVFTPFTDPGGIVYKDELAAFLNRYHAYVVKPEIVSQNKTAWAKAEQWVRDHVKTSIAAALAAGAGGAQIDYGELVSEIGRVLSGG